MATTDVRAIVKGMALVGGAGLVTALVAGYASIIGCLLPDLLRVFGYLAFVFPKAFSWASGWHDRSLHIGILSTLTVACGVSYALLIGLSVAAYVKQRSASKE